MDANLKRFKGFQLQLIPRLSVAWSLPISLTSVAFYSFSPHLKAIATWSPFCIPTHWHFLPWAIYSTRWWCRHSSSWTSDLCFLELMIYKEKQSTYIYIYVYIYIYIFNHFKFYEEIILEQCWAWELMTASLIWEFSWNGKYEIAVCAYSKKPHKHAQLLFKSLSV